MKAPTIASPHPPWRSLTEIPVLGRDDVHVWRASLERSASEIRDFRCNLDADEQSRAEQFHFEKDRAHFVVARGVLRAILGRYLNQAPKSLSFCYSSHGKPALAGKSEGDATCFNVSHSHGLCLYAVARGLEVGIDLERIRSDLALAEIAERYFSPREVALLRAIPAEMQRQAFFRIWTRKEAYIKARGEGLSLLGAELDLPLAPGEADEMLGAQRDQSEASRWSLQVLDPGHGYAAALAVQARAFKLSCWQWPDS